MTESALPTIPSSDKAGTSSPQASARGKETGKAGDSQFDNVSRQEQDRLDKRNARPASERNSDSEKSTTAKKGTGKAAGSATPEKAGKAEAGSTAKATDATPSSADGVSGEMTELPPLPELEGMFTFADLQALVSAEDGQITASDQGLPAPVMAPFALQSSASSDALMPITVNRLLGNGNVLKGQGAGSILEAGTQMVETILGQSADSGKAADLTTVTGLGRFQGALESASQQLSANPGQKVPETMVPLRGYTTSIDVPVGGAEWGDKLMGKLTWLTSQKMSATEIHLTPPDMGPMEVRIQVQNDQATVVVHSANQAVRDQLELNSHRLRDMLNEQGLELEGFDVSDSSGQASEGERDPDGTGAGVADGSGATGENADGLDSTGALDLAWRGEVDLYA